MLATLRAASPREMTDLLVKGLALSAAIIGAACGGGSAFPAAKTIAPGTLTARSAITPPPAERGVTSRPDKAVTAEQAIDTAELMTGGRAVSLVLREDHGDPCYVVRTLSRDHTAEVYVDAAMGNARSIVDLGPVEACFHGDMLAALEDIGKGGTDMVEAIYAAQRTHSGAVVEARPTIVGRRAAFDLTFVDHGQAVVTQASAGSGRLLVAGG